MPIKSEMNQNSMYKLYTTILSPVISDVALWPLLRTSGCDINARFLLYKFSIFNFAGIFYETKTCIINIHIKLMVYLSSAELHYLYNRFLFDVKTLTGLSLFLSEQF